MSASDLPPGLQYSEDDEAEALAAAFRNKPTVNAFVRSETARLVIEKHDLVPRLRWFKRWRLVRVLKVLEREERAYRG